MIWPWDRLTTIEFNMRVLESQILRLIGKVDSLTALTRRQGGRLMALVDDVLADVADLPTIDASLGQFLDNLKQQLADALANGDTVKLQQIKDALDQHKQRIIDDIKATP